MATKMGDNRYTFPATTEVEILGPLTLSGTQATILTKTVPFVLANIQAGNVGFDFDEAHITVLSTHIVMTTQLTFSAGTTTGVTVKVGTGVDDDGFATATQLSGITGFRYLTKGVLVNQPVDGGIENNGATFTATGGTPVLAQVSAGAGTLVIKYIALD